MSYPVLELEREADPTAVWVSYGVRMKLDLCGVKIGLAAWKKLDRTDRDLLCDVSAETDIQIAAFARALADAAARASVQLENLSEQKLAAVSTWKDPGRVPKVVAALQADLDMTVLWARLDRFGRYLAYSFARRGDGAIMERALREAGLLADRA